MSRLPSSLENGSGPSGVRKVRGPDFGGGPGTSETLDAPGLAPLPAATSDPSAELFRIYGLVGDVAGQIGGMARRAEARSEQQSIEYRQARVGMARRDAALDRLDLEQQIAERKIAVPEGMPVSDFVREWTSTRAREVTNDTDYLDAYTDSLAPWMGARLIDEHEKIRAENKASLLQNFRDAAVHAPDASGIAGAVEAAQRLGMSREEALAQVALPALATAAKGRDRARYDAAREVLGDGFATEQANAEAVMLRAEEDHRRSVYESATQDVFNALNSGDAGRFAESRARIAKNRENGNLSEEQAFRLEQTVGTEEGQAQRAAAGELKAVMEDRIRSGYEQQVDALGQAGMLAVLDSLSETNPVDGTQVTMSREAAIQQFYRREFTRIAQRFPDDEAAQLAQQVRVVARNGVAPDSWARVMRAGFVAAAEQEFEDKDGNPTVPPATAAGFALYSRIAAQAPGLAESLLDNDRTRRFYDLAQVAREDPSELAKDDTAALVTARRAINRLDRMGGALPEPDKKKIESESVRIVDRPGWLTGSMNNKTEVATAISARARSYAVLGLSPEAAVERAAQALFRNVAEINGFAVPTSGLGIPQDAVPLIGPVGSGIIDEFYAANQQRLTDAGVKKSGLALQPDPTTGQWSIIDSISGVALDAPAVSTNELIRRARASQVQKPMLPPKPAPIAPPKPLTPEQEAAIMRMESRYNRRPL